MKINGNYNSNIYSSISQSMSRQFKSNNTRVESNQVSILGFSKNKSGDISQSNIDSAKGSNNFLKSFISDIKSISSDNLLTLNSFGPQGGNITSINSVYNAKGLFGSDLGVASNVGLLFENKV